MSIINNPENTKDVISWLNENVLKFIDKDYYSRVNNEIITNLDNENFIICQDFKYGSRGGHLVAPAAMQYISFELLDKK